ncbi:hypothetical protein [Pseudomonas rhizophila]|uniref:hypothetical protein n=1 Tax=Pseudomonas rhizophila TaxID=2045200 RepID=UPI0030DB598A
MSQIKERPILFSAPMVRAILEDRKTVTRRVIKPQPTWDGKWFQWDGHAPNSKDGAVGGNTIEAADLMCWSSPYGKRGDQLWVRETWGLQVRRYGGGTGEHIVYRATNPDAIYCKSAEGREYPVKWKPSIHMPRHSSRILLEITDVRVERLQDISEEQAKAEGIVGVAFRPDDGWPICTGYMVGPDDGKSQLQTTAVGAFAGLWSSINGQENWDANPWVWVVEFKRVTP